MPNDYIELKFDPEELTLSAVLTPHIIAHFAEEPGKFIGAARLKMASLSQDRRLGGYVLYESAFYKAWEVLQHQSQSTSLTLVLASGYPALAGVSLRPISAEESGFLLDITTPIDQMAEYQLEWFITYLQSILAKRREDIELNVADVECAWYRYVINHLPVTNFYVGLRPIPSTHNARFAVIAKPRRIVPHLLLRVHEGPRSSPLNPEDVLRLATVEIERMASQPGSSGYYRLDQNWVNRAISAFTGGYHQLGIGLPSERLIGILHQVNDDEVLAPERDAGFVLAKASDTAVQPDIPGSLTFAGVKHWHPETTSYHHRSLQKAKHALTEWTANQRDYETMTLALDEAGALRLQSKLASFAASMPLCSGEPTEVLTVMIQTFPLTRGKQERLSTVQAGLSGIDVPWQKLVLRELVGLDTFREKPDWIGSKLILEITEDEAEKGLHDLLKGGFLFRDPGKGGRLTQTNRNILTGDESPNEFIANYHVFMLTLAQEMMNLGADIRQQFSVYYIPSNTKHREFVRQHIKTFLHEIFDDAGNALLPDQLYQLGLQCFPMLTVEKLVSRAQI